LGAVPAAGQVITGGGAGAKYEDWLHYVAPALIIPWLVWACYELAWKNAPEGINPVWLRIPLIDGAAIGGLVG